MSRRFSDHERIALYVEAGGKCSACGTDLDQGWHGDHVLPYSHGGPTDVVNGQALCPKCNLKKGSCVNLSLPAWPQGDRNWQIRAYSQYTIKNAQDFLAVVTPGGGKTQFALKVAHNLLLTGLVRRIVVVVPTDHLRQQWMINAKKFGIDLNPKWSNSDGAEASDFHGVVVTYQQVASAPHIHRMHCKKSTLVVFDEIHHAGESLSWGRSVKNAFDLATRRLAMSGTAFRNDSNPIPFINYENGRSVADFYYSYADALDDDVCRAMLFPSYEGEMTWLSIHGMTTATFRDELSEEEASRRLRTALDVNGDWLRTVLQEADRKLCEVRKLGHEDAAGLVIAMDQNHAKSVAQLLSRIAREDVEVAISEDPLASERISTFARGIGKWIVAVKMISEGVDIPRLRIGVYATNVISQLFFRQAVGRFVRIIPGLDEQNAYLFMPRDDVLISYAQEIKDEREHQLAEYIDRGVQEAREAVESRDRQLALFQAISTSEATPDDVISDGQLFPQAELELARHIRQQMGVLGQQLTDVHIALIGRLYGPQRVEPQVVEQQTEQAEPLYIQKKKLSKAINRLVGRYCILTGVSHRDANQRLAEATGAYVKSSTVEQLVERMRLLQSWITDVDNGNYKPAR